MSIIFDVADAISDIFGAKYNLMHTLPIDVTIAEVHSLRSRLTDRPVEGGAVITDNIILLPTTVKIQGILAGDFFKGITLLQKFDELKKIRLTREPFTLTTSLDVYESMYFDGEIVINREASNIKSIFFETTLKQVNIIESLTTTVPDSSVAQDGDSKGKRARGGKKDLGKKSSSKVSDKEKSWIIGVLG